MNVIVQILTIVGSLGLFLFGMKLMSESLQKIAGDRMKLMLSTMSSNPLKGVFAGVVITALIQSSSATTVMVVSFVNSGMIRLIEAIAIIMGANIGTTITAWIISILGFKLNITALLLPIIGISIPFTFSSNRKYRNIGEMVLGFVLLFIGINFLSDSVPEYSVYVKLSAFIKSVSTLNYISYFIFLIFGALLTILIKSSSTTIALTLVLCNNGWFGFDVAAAMVLGENIGSTITANIAAKVANTAARRAARSHFIFNLIGVVWMMILFPFFLKGIAFIQNGLGLGNPYENIKDIPVGISLFHTLFNLFNTFFLIWFIQSLAQFVTKVVPQRGNEDEFKLAQIKIGLLSTPSASIYQARRETVTFAENIRIMFNNVSRLSYIQHNDEYEVIRKTIYTTEEYADRLEREVAIYLTKVGEGRLSESNSRQLRSLYKMIDDIESIADCCINITHAIERKRNAKISFPDYIDNNINLMFSMVKDALDTMVTMFSHESDLPLSLAQDKEKEINNFRDILKSEHLENLEKGIYNYDAGIIYNDIISQCERLGDFTINVDESIKQMH